MQPRSAPGRNQGQWRWKAGERHFILVRPSRRLAGQTSLGAVANGQSRHEQKQTRDRNNGIERHSESTHNGLAHPFIASHPTAASGVNNSPTRRQPVRAAHGNPHKRDAKKTAVPSVKSSPHVGVRLHLWGSKRRTWKGLENTTTSPSPPLPPLPTGKPCRIALYVQALADGLVHPGCRARPRRQLGGSKAMNESVVG